MVKVKLSARVSRQMRIKLTIRGSELKRTTFLTRRVIAQFVSNTMPRQ
jgi:hypothetical protein